MSTFVFSRLAIKYIKHLQYLLSFAPDQRIPSHIVEFDPSRPAWNKGINGNVEPEMVNKCTTS
jgi:hypothetical protein